MAGMDASSSVPNIFFILVVLTGSTTSDNKYVPFTSEVFPIPPNGTVGVFWDTNNDRMTDVMFWHGLDVVIYQSSSGLQQKHPVLHPQPHIITIDKTNVKEICALIPGDFNGDLILDLVIVVLNSTDNYSLRVAWGKFNASNHWAPSKASKVLRGGLEVELNMLRQPTVIDYDGNTVPDFLIQLESGIHRLKVDLVKAKGGDNEWTLKPWKIWDQFGKMVDGQSNAFVDIDSDLIADIVLVMEDSKGNVSLVFCQHKPFFEEQEVVHDPFEEPIAVSLNDSLGIKSFGLVNLGQITFVDFNDDSHIDTIIPVQSTDGETTKIILFDWAKDSFTDISPEWNGWTLAPANRKAGVPLRLHIGDYDQDGFADAVAVGIKNNVNQTILLSNSAIDETNPDSGNRKFKLASTEKTVDLKTAPDETLLMAAFFDAYDDGFLDILLLFESKSNGVRFVRAYRNSLGIDATWIKAMVYTGYCGLQDDDLPTRNCPNRFSSRALSLPVVGATIKMDTTRGDGGPQLVVAGLLTQFTHFALQMPTTIFGLGRSPNFVDRITVGLAPVVNLTGGERHTRDFEQTIPNSAVVISPTPLNKPGRWRAFIYVTPSSAMLETGIVLSVVFALLLVLVGLLHFKERREDQKEKLVNMQRFHFDAM